MNRRDLPGTPDIVLSRARLAIFVDGCFWHACPTHYVAPKSNSLWWQTKLAGNRERDRRKDAQLKTSGWQVMHFWEHEPAEVAAEVIAREWRIRTGRA